MTDTIKLVAGDNRPNIKLTLTKIDGTAVDLSGGDTTVSIKFRSVGSESTLVTLSTTKVGSGATGEVTFNFPGDTLDVPAGFYEGEIEVDFGSEKQRVFDRLKFQVREAFT
ncbi:Domain of unknown function DUF2479 [uncultured Caudovirales phage]|uniref:Uncharacterized protein n=1 Tax=uncultured Caudovirales phage TaxID=2100421 RepID=A0A6J5LBF4_9CAUD|nr:Domain of unknown function DUF2479 [uncultured Caudovirales phage]